jgi:hypothetical protein
VRYAKPVLLNRREECFNAKNAKRAKKMRNRGLGLGALGGVLENVTLHPNATGNVGLGRTITTENTEEHGEEKDLIRRGGTRKQAIS